MKKYIFLVLTSILLGLTSCTKDSEDPIIPPSDNIRYYVKYIVSTEYTQAQGSLKDDKSVIRNFSKNGEYVYGPVDKGFEAQLDITHCNRTTKGIILVSINEEPFTIKASKETYGEPIHLTYKIE